MANGAALPSNEEFLPVAREFPKKHPFFSDYVVPALAVWGAILSTTLAFVRVRESRRNIKVETSTVSDKHSRQLYLKIEATNVGSRPVVVKELLLTSSDGKRIAPKGENILPETHLKDGEKCSIDISNLELADAITKEVGDRTIKLVPRCIDTAGGVHCGRAWEVDANKLVSANREAPLPQR